MPDIYRPRVKVGSCITLMEKSKEISGYPDILRHHERRETEGFPQKVARFGNAILYVEAELDAFYQSVLWRQGNRSITELTGELTHEAV